MLKKPEWPGISIAVGIILIVTLIVVGLRDDFHLKDYASVIAAFVAVGGAMIAYQAAMAKIDEDRSRELRELDRRKLRLYLRLRFGLQRLSNHADAKDFIVDPPLNKDGTKSVNPLIEVKSLRLDARSEIDEAWENLDLLPNLVAAEIDWLRREMLSIDEMLAGLPDKVHAMEFWIPNELHGNYRQSYRGIASHASNAVAVLNSTVKQLNVS